MINSLCVELTVEFSQATYNGREDSEHISVTLNLLGGTAMYDFSVNVSTSPISATGKHDISFLWCDLLYVATYVAVFAGYTSN